MIEGLYNTIAVKLQTEQAWITKTAGIAQVLKLDVNGKKVTIPATRVTAENCKPGDYTDLAPNSAETAIAFFEVINVEQKRVMYGNVAQFIAKARLVVWVNTSKVDATLDKVISQCAKSVSGNINTTGLEVSNVRTWYIGPETGSAWDKYSLDESKTQFLMTPFASVSLTFMTSFVASICAATIETAEVCS